MTGKAKIELILELKANTLAIQLADAWMPFSNKLKQIAVDMLGWVDWNLAKNQNDRKRVFYNEGVAKARELFPEDSLAAFSREQMQNFMGKIITARNDARKTYIERGAERDKISDWNIFFAGDRPLFQDYDEYRDTKTAYRADTAKGKFEYLDKIYRDGWKLWEQATNGGKNIKTAGNTANSNGSSSDNNGNLLGSSVASVTGSAKQIRNITVNIDSFNKGGINTQNTSLQKMDARQIDEWFTNICMKALRNIELSYG